jgi:hypothetical protein
MSVAAAIRTMLAAGLTIDQALIAVEALEQAKGSRSAGAERQARYRERQRASLVTSRDACDVTDEATLPPPVPPLSTCLNNSQPWTNFSHPQNFE